MSGHPRARALLRTVALAAVVLFASACAHHDDVTVITFWTIGREGEVVRELLDDFERNGLVIPAAA